ncbi:MAG: hypothetical protein ACYTHJ_00135 [Planctomycetota bacterium]
MIAALTLPVGGARGQSPAPVFPEPKAPEIKASHKKFLSRVARRTVRDELLNRGFYEPDYVPDALAALNCEVLIQLRHSGFLLGAGVGAPAPVTDAVRDAAITAARAVRDANYIDKDQVGDLLIEIELVGEPERFVVQGDWTRPRSVAPFIEPGIHGMVVGGPRSTHRFSPTEVFTSDVVLPEALQRLSQHTHGHSEGVGNARLMRFRTTHWYVPGNSQEIVPLQRGLLLVRPEEVTADRLNSAIESLAEYMCYRQLDTGMFTYQYEVGYDRYSEDNSLVRQAGAAAALAAHATSSGRSASRGAADLAIRFHLQGFTRIPDVTDASYIATADKQNKLGVTALLAQAMLLHPEPAKYGAERQQLINGMLWLQRPSGMFITAFPPAVEVEGQAHFPGEALHALALQYRLKPSERILGSFSRAIEYYRALFRDREAPSLVPWQMQAYAIMADLSKRVDYREFVFELADWVSARQLNQTNCPWPALWGGIAAYQPGRADISTASFLEGMCDAALLARRSGDLARASRYEDVMRLAARFVLQLQFKPEEAYFVRSPRDAVGGMRRTPTLNLLRISHCQHALVALMKTRDVLYPR